MGLQWFEGELHTCCNAMALPESPIEALILFGGVISSRGAALEMRFCAEG